MTETATQSKNAPCATCANQKLDSEGQEYCDEFGEAVGVIASCGCWAPRNAENKEERGQQDGPEEEENEAAPETEEPAETIDSEPTEEGIGSEDEASPEDKVSSTTVTIDGATFPMNEDGTFPDETKTAIQAVVADKINERRSLSDRSISEETPEAKTTTEFDLNELPGVRDTLEMHRAQIYRYFHEGGDETPVMNLKLAFGRGSVKGQIVTTIPHKIKSDIVATDLVHENGDIRLLRAVRQVDMFGAGVNPETPVTVEIAPESDESPADVSVPDFFEIFTQTRLKLLQLCPKKQWFRYERGLVPQSSKEEALWFGTVIHMCLDVWHDPSERTRQERIEAIKEIIATNFQNRDQDEKERKLWHYARAMVRAYMLKFPLGSESWTSSATEKFFHGPIVNPETGEAISWAIYAGKLDLAGLWGDQTKFIGEHKTATTIDSSYLEALQNDLQIIGYALYAGEQEGCTYNRILYNVLAKPMLKQSKGETQEEYLTRYAEACTKAKSGKSSAKRNMPETDDEFQKRLADWYEKPEKLHREEILIDQRQYDEVRRELWNLCQLYLHMRTSGNWPRNRKACYGMSGKCGYYDACMARPEEEEQMIELYLRPEPPHAELQEFLGEVLRTKGKETETAEDGGEPVDLAPPVDSDGVATENDEPDGNESVSQDGPEATTQDAPDDNAGANDNSETPNEDF